MNKTQLVDIVQTKLPATATKKLAEDALNAVLDAIREAVKTDKVQLVGFGTFEMKTRAARTGRNPQTGEAMKIAASATLAFRPSSTFKTVIKPAKRTCAKRSCKKK
ncbi:MAG: HU family DNA-binding protein [Akkermansia sp.]